MGPASLCDVEPHARSGRSVGLARPFGLWVARSASWSPMKRRRDPTTVLVLRRVATTWLPPWPGRSQLAGGLAARGTLSTPPHGIAAKPPDRSTLRLLALRLKPPMAMSDSGLPCPVSFPTASRYRRISPPIPSSTVPLTPEAYMSRCRAHWSRGGLSPISTEPKSSDGVSAYAGYRRGASLGGKDR